MTGINRIGQRVVCIERSFDVLWCPNIDPLPEYKGEYTVSGFETVVDIPGIHLREFADTTCNCVGKKMPWPIQCFRPIVDDQIKNEHVTKIVNKAKVPAPIKPIKKVKEKIE